MAPTMAKEKPGGSGHNRLSSTASRPCAGRARATATSSCGLRGGMADRNEGKALDAVLRFIEVRGNAHGKNDGRSPDDPNDPDPDPLRRVDYVCTVRQTLYAFEHTRIEPFPNQIRLEHRMLI